MCRNILTKEIYQVKWHLDERIVLKGDDNWFPVMKTEGKFHRSNTKRQKYVQRRERKLTFTEHYVVFLWLL